MCRFLAEKVLLRRSRWLCVPHEICVGTVCSSRWNCVGYWVLDWASIVLITWTHNRGELHVISMVSARVSISVGVSD